MKAFSKSKNLKKAEIDLKKIFEKELKKVESITKDISKRFKIK